MELKSVKIQYVNGSYYAYLPKQWVKSMGYDKGEVMCWFINENDHSTLKLKKKDLNHV